MCLFVALPTSPVRGPDLRGKFSWETAPEKSGVQNAHIRRGLEAGGSQPFADETAKIKPNEIHRKSYHFSAQIRNGFLERNDLVELVGLELSHGVDNT
jgi:hypothetical protein